jgi:hypothetical protein
VGRGNGGANAPRNKVFLLLFVHKKKSLLRLRFFLPENPTISSEIILR